MFLFSRRFSIIRERERERESLLSSYDYIISSDKPENINSIITHKKLDALKRLYHKYEYLAVIDAECLFLRPTTPYLKDIWDKNCFVANSSCLGSEYIIHCLQDMKINNYPYDVNFYYWFNEMQVYPSYLIPEFLSWIGKSNIHIYSFDYLLFTVFMIMNHGHKLRVIESPCKALNGLAEELGADKQAPYRRDIVKHIHWSTWFDGIEEFENIKMVFHLDRYPIKRQKL